MLSDSQRACCPELELNVKQLLVEDSLFDQSERRTVHREFLFRPVLIQLRDCQQSYEGFTRNISYLGVSMVTRQLIPPQSIAKIQIYRLNSPPSIFLAECRWSNQFGEDWNISGWNFLNVNTTRL